MSVKIEDKSSVQKRLLFEIPEKNVTKELNHAYNELNKKANIKGFRKGKIPRKILENRFSKDIHAEVASRLIQDIFTETIKKHNLNIVSELKLDPPELESGKPYIFDITVEIKPELDDIDFKGIELEQTKYKISEGEIESQIHMIQKTMAKKETVTEERPVKDSDFVLIDYQGFYNEQAFDATPKIENYLMKIGQDAMPKEFSEKLTGVTPVQELEVEVPYSDDYHDENLKGKNIIYKVKLKEIQEEVLPEINDDLAKDLGQFKTLDDVRKSICENLEKGYAQRIQHELSEQIFQTLLKKNEFEVPESIIERELNGIITEAEKKYSANNTTLKEAGLNKDALKTEYRDVAEKQARRHLILDKIITQEKFELTDEELEKSFEEMALGMHAPVDLVKNYFNANQEQLDIYKYTQLGKKAVKIIIEQGNITEVEPNTVQNNTDADSNNTDADSNDDTKDNTDNDDTSVKTYNKFKE